MADEQPAAEAETLGNLRSEVAGLRREMVVGEEVLVEVKALRGRVTASVGNIERLVAEIRRRMEGGGDAGG